MIPILLGTVGFLVLKKTSGASLPASPVTRSSNAVAHAGVAPSNGIMNSPGGERPVMTLEEAYDEDDDGAMNATVMGASPASSDSPGVGLYDSHETQSSSGMDTEATEIWRQPKKTGRHGRVLEETWEEALDVDYISSSPSIQYMYMPPPMMRTNNNPRFNNQPWAGRMGFQATDPSGVFETDPQDPSVPYIDEDEDSE